MHRNNSKRKIVIYSLLGVLLLMTVGYASFQSSLKIKGTSKVSSNWDIEITNVTSGTSTGSAENGKDENGNVVLPSWDKLNASISADLYEPGDSMTYVVTIENKGTLDAKIDDIIPSQNSGNDNIVSNDGVKTTFSGYTKGQMLYKAGQSGSKMDITVKIEYNDGYTGGPTSLETNLQFNFVQAESKEVDNNEVISENSHKVTYDYISNGGDKKTYERYYQEGEEIDLTLGTDEKYNLKDEYIFIGWNTASNSTEKLETLIMGDSDVHLYAIYKEDNIVINSINTTSTTNSITVVVDALADSGIKKIEYSNDDGDTWEEITEGEDINIHTIVSLTKNTNYNIKIRLTTNTYKSVKSETIIVKTNDIEIPIFSVNKDGYADSKEVTINYKNQTNNNLNYYYSFDNTAWTESSNVQTVNFNTEGAINAKISDGVNQITSTYTVTMIDDSIIGEINTYTGSSVPEGYLLCNGQAVSRTTYSELFNIIGTTYGSGDGSTTFNLPDLNDRKVVGVNSTYTIGKTGGSSTTTLSTVPSHTHVIPALSGTAASNGAHQHYVDPANTSAKIITLAANSNTVTDIWDKYSNGYGFRFYGDVVWYSEWGKGRTNVVASAGAHTHSVTTNASTTGAKGSKTAFSVQNAFIKTNYYIKAKINKYDNGYNGGIKSARIGKMMVWTSNNIPAGYLLCNGQAVSRTTYKDLFNVIGTTYGTGNGSTTFNLPNTVNKTVIGGTNGTTGGSNSVTLKVENLPSHTHSIPALSGTAKSNGAHQHYVDPANSNAYTFSLADRSDKVSNLYRGYGKNQGYSGASNNWYSEWGKGRTNVVASAGAHKHSVTTTASNTESTGSGTALTVTNPYINEKHIIKAQSQTTPSGTIKQWPSNTIPAGYLLCNGQAVSRTTYKALYEAIGTTYGAGDGSTTFNLPNMQGRQVFGTDTSAAVGGTGGSNTVNVTASNIPSHNHSIPALSGTAASNGAHQHNIDTANASAYTITLNQNSNSVSNRWCAVADKKGFYSTSTSGNGYDFYNWGKGRTSLVASAGAHTHSVSTNKGTTGSPNSTTSVSVSTENKYIALNYIIKY